jgi:hypothetical protein
MNIRPIALSTLALAVIGSACTKQEQERIGASPVQSEVRALQVEAQQMLQQVHAMQESHYAANMQYGASLGEIGVAIPSNARYRYSLSASGSAWSCKATANLDRDPAVDTWVVDQSGSVACTTNDAIS